MIVNSLDVLGKFSKDELLEVALDKRNDLSIQDIALHKWMAINEQEHIESMTRMRALLRQSWELMRKSA